MNFSLVILAMLFLLGCSNSYENEDLRNDSFDWLQGRWENQLGDMQFVESWRISDNGLTGVGYFIRSGDTLVKEQLWIKSLGDDVVYIAKVNRNSPVLFTKISHSADSIVFENPEHDFPQRIRYMVPKDDTLFVRTSGMKDSIERFEDFYFFRKSD